jgi:hypothetical protein
MGGAASARPTRFSLSLSISETNPSHTHTHTKRKSPQFEKSLAAACLLIACKIEPGMESWRSLDAVASAAQALRAPRDPAKVALARREQQQHGGGGASAHLCALADKVATAERAVLLALNFDVRLPARPPVRWARDVCRSKAGGGDGGDGGAPPAPGSLEAAAVAILRDVGYTPAPLMAPPEALAKAALWLAARLEAADKNKEKEKLPPAPPASMGAALPERLAALYARVPQARVEELARVLERTPAVVRMRAGIGGLEEQKPVAKRGREEREEKD